jgi:hypothetical protein
MTGQAHLHCGSALKSNHIVFASTVFSASGAARASRALSKIVLPMPRRLHYTNIT